MRKSCKRQPGTIWPYRKHSNPNEISDTLFPSEANDLQDEYKTRRGKTLRLNPTPNYSDMDRFWKQSDYKIYSKTNLAITSQKSSIVFSSNHSRENPAMSLDFLHSATIFSAFLIFEVSPKSTLGRWVGFGFCLSSWSGAEIKEAAIDSSCSDQVRLILNCLSRMDWKSSADEYQQ